MRYQSFIFGLAAIAFSTTIVSAKVPLSVRCSVLAQKEASDAGPEYKQVYNRTFELCMVRAMPRERQTTYFIEKLRPYVAISPGPPARSEISPSRSIKAEKSKSNGTWVRISPNVWVLNRE